jgi:hypothetical protein
MTSAEPLQIARECDEYDPTERTVELLTQGNITARPASVLGVTQLRPPAQRISPDQKVRFWK